MAVAFIIHTAFLDRFDDARPVDRDDMHASDAVGGQRATQRIGVDEPRAEQRLALGGQDNVPGAIAGKAPIAAGGELDGALE
jgi:hypothetical protein